MPIELKTLHTTVQVLRENDRLSFTRRDIIKMHLCAVLDPWSVSKYILYVYISRRWLGFLLIAHSTLTVAVAAIIGSIAQQFLLYYVCGTLYSSKRARNVANSTGG